MKHYILFVSLIALCSGSNLYAKELTGWGKAKFGMTSKEVQDAFGNIAQELSKEDKDSNSEYDNNSGQVFSTVTRLNIPKINFDGLEVYVTFNFGKMTGKLREITLAKMTWILDGKAKYSQMPESEITEKCERVHLGLKQEYGEPTPFDKDGMKFDIFALYGGQVSYSFKEQRSGEHLKNLGCTIVFLQDYDDSIELGTKPTSISGPDKGINAWGDGDYATALNEFKPLAAHNNAVAQFYLGMMYGGGEGVVASLKTEVYWLLKSAEQGNVEAQSLLGTVYAEGGKGVPKDLKKALYWFGKAANHGYEAAQLELAIMYFKGFGVQSDNVTALTWLKKSAGQGYARAQFNLGARYYFGDGVPQDFTIALFWLEKAAEKGNTDAQFNIGLMYGAGDLGTPVDWEKTYFWCSLSAASGDKSQIKYRDDAEAHLTHAQVLDVQSKVREWVELHKRH